MRSLAAAAATAAIVLLGFFGAPLAPVAAGVGLACGWAWRRKRAGA